VAEHTPHAAHPAAHLGTHPAHLSAQDLLIGLANKSALMFRRAVQGVASSTQPVLISSAKIIIAATFLSKLALYLADRFF
jgi:hypothetical protein